MRLVADIEAEWDAAFTAVSDRERMDVCMHNWLTISAEHRGQGRLDLPERLLSDPSLTSPERFVLAALSSVSRDVDAAGPEVTPAIMARLCGEFINERDTQILGHAIASLVYRGVLIRTFRGGLMERGQ